MSEFDQRPPAPSGSPYERGRQAEPAPTESMPTPRDTRVSPGEQGPWAPTAGADASSAADAAQAHRAESTPTQSMPSPAQPAPQDPRVNPDERGPWASAGATGAAGASTAPGATAAQGGAGTAGGYRPQSQAPTYQPGRQVLPPAQPPRKGHPFLWGLLGGVICSGVLALLLWAFGVFTPTFLANPGPTGGQDINIQVGNGDEDITVAEAVSAKCSPSVATLTVTTDSAAYGGSGVLLDEEGHMLTNSHVVEGAQAISCNIGGGSYSATLVGSDPSSDLAVILVDFQGDVHQPIEIGDSSALEVGDWVMAIGSPFGLDLSVSSGIVSSLYHSTILTSQGGNKIYTNLIQTDAAINPGNSGGALVNERGELVGINSIIQSYSGSSSGVGFAIPSEYAVNVAQTIINGQQVEHAYLGTNIRTVNAQVQALNNLPVSQGAYVVSVTQDGPAAKAGLQEGDIITAVGDTPVTSADGLILAVRSKAVGDQTTITYWRGGEEHTVDVTLGSDATTTGNDTSAGDAYQQNPYQNQDGQGGNGYDQGTPYGQELTPDQLQDLLNQLFQ